MIADFTRTNSRKLASNDTGREEATTHYTGTRARCVLIGGSTCDPILEFLLQYVNTITTTALRNLNNIFMNSKFCIMSKCCIYNSLSKITLALVSDDEVM